jgi:hypothetical protein
VIPVTAHAIIEFSYLRQTVRTNNAAVVAEGAVKPTSIYTVNKIPNSLVVIAHLSEGIPRFWLIDQVSLDTFVSSELEFGLRLAVEAKVLADVNGSSGIQTQAYATSVLATLRKSLTKLETAGYTPGSLVIHTSRLGSSRVGAVERDRHRTPQPAVRSGDETTVRRASHHQQCSGCWCRSRDRFRRCRTRHRHPRCRRAMERERHRRQLREKLSVC